MTSEFAGFDHVDVRVRDVRAVEAFYDALLPWLGLPRKRHAFVDPGGEWREPAAGEANNVIEYYEPEGVANPRFIGFIEDKAMAPSRTRIAFRLPQGADWREIEPFLRSIGARNVEPASDLAAYPAIFFEDPAGTRLEICWGPVFGA